MDGKETSTSPEQKHSVTAKREVRAIVTERYDSQKVSAVSHDKPEATPERESDLVKYEWSGCGGNKHS